MLEDAVRETLLFALAEQYETDPSRFWQVSNSDLASACIRQTMAELRNAGYVEEAVRGVVRFTHRGYVAYRSGQDLLPAYLN